VKMMRREAFDELYDKQAKCAHCGHEYESHYQGAGGDYDWKTQKYGVEPMEQIAKEVERR